MSSLSKSVRISDSTNFNDYNDALESQLADAQTFTTSQSCVVEEGEEENESFEGMAVSLSMELPSDLDAIDSDDSPSHDDDDDDSDDDDETEDEREWVKNRNDGSNGRTSDRDSLVSENHMLKAELQRVRKKLQRAKVDRNEQRRNGKQLQKDLRKQNKTVEKLKKRCKQYQDEAVALSNKMSEHLYAVEQQKDSVKRKFDEMKQNHAAELDSMRKKQCKEQTEAKRELRDMRERVKMYKHNLRYYECLDSVGIGQELKYMQPKFTDGTASSNWKRK